MSEIDRWLSQYGDSHREISHPALYWLAVLMLVPATAGLLWSLPLPEAFVQISPVLNWGSMFLMVALVYYFIISFSLAIGMLPFIFAVTALGFWLTRSGLSVAGASIGLMIAAVAGLYVGRRGSGGVRAVRRDIQLMVIGPIWLLSKLYRRLGIRV